MERPRRPHARRADAGGKQRQFRRRLARYRAERLAGRPPRPKIPPIAVPSFFTLMNLFSGFLSVIQTFEGHFAYAAWLIVLAAFFDVLDGMMARLTNSHSPFGIELDSLADVVSFGLAPSFLVYVFHLNAFGVLGLIVSALPVICGAVRLARFNVAFSGEKKDFFVGLPIPGQGIFIVALILNVNDASWFDPYGPSNLPLLMPVVAVVALLMVSNIPFDAIPKPSPAWIRAHPRKFGLYATGLLLIVVFQQIGLLLVLSVYLIVNVVLAIYHVIRDVAETPTEEELAHRDSENGEEVR